MNGVPANKALVRRYYDEMWNRWDLTLTDELLAPDIQFRGSLGTVAEGVKGFRRYARAVWLAFPDFHNEITDIVADRDVVVARMAFSGTHRGELLGIAATGRAVRYEGIAWFRITDGRIAEVIVMADRESLLSQISA